MRDLHSRMNERVRVQITSDGFGAYTEEVPHVMGLAPAGVDFAQYVKLYSVGEEDEPATDRFSNLARYRGARKETHHGPP